MWQNSIGVISLLLLIGVVRHNDCFNLDVANYTMLRGNYNSMFGFTVAMHRERGHSWVLVGAPEAETEQPGVTRGGAVYRCSIDVDNSCQTLPFDRNGHNVDKDSNYVDSKSKQWFGATLNSAGEDGPVVACAPRYVYFSKKRDRRDPVGTCFVSRNDFTSYSEYSPCRTNLFGYHRQGSCQAGFGAAISKDGRRLFVGGPGSWYWQGQMYSIDAHATFPFAPPDGFVNPRHFGSGQVIQQSLETRPSVVQTREGTERDDDSYLGYSVAVGDFAGDGEQGVAVGMPRGAELLGKIVLFTWNLTNHHNITGSQLGAYFGYAIAAGDVDGDGTDDLIIGAPLHTEPNNEDKYEVGRVYIVFQGRDATKRFRRLNTIDGKNSKSRFGLALASLGDINSDGYGDFAVGAPYDGVNERGAVYVYHGSKDVIGEKYAQVIFAEDIAVPGIALATFGFSISGGLDLDQNDYPDMAVGAYLSDTAFFFRSRPVVKIDSYVKFLTNNKQIVLEEKNCSTNGQMVPCTTIDFCIKFSGINVPYYINLDVQFILDSKKPKDPRMFFVDHEGRNTHNQTLNLQKNSRHFCTPQVVYIKNDIRDKLTPLEVEVRYSMRDGGALSHYSYRNPRSPLHPILDLNNPPVKKDTISIHKNCGADNICIPNLRLIANSNVQRYLLGSKEKLEFEIIVQNEGEDSFESTFEIIIPPGVDFNKIVQYNKTEVRILCSSFNNSVKCDIGNPLPGGKIARFTIVMTPSLHKAGMRPSYDFKMNVNSTNPERSGTTSDNTVEMSIHLWVDSKLELAGISRPADVHYNLSSYPETISKENDIGPQVIHLYSIKNNGPSGVNEADVIFVWPYATLGGDDLLYLLEPPHIYGNIRCDRVDSNIHGYELEFRKKTIWETIGIDVLKGGEIAAGHHITIEEGRTTYGQTGEEKIATKQTESDYALTGDGSHIHGQRRKQEFEGRGGSSSSSSSSSTTSSTSSGGGHKVIVGEDTGSGSRVFETSHSSSSSSFNRSHVTPGGVTHTYSRNVTTYVGPDGRVHRYESTSTDGGAAGGGGASNRVHYTSSGSRGQTNNTRLYATGSGGSSSSSGQSSHGEDRMITSSGGSVSSSSSSSSFDRRTQQSGGSATGGRTSSGGEILVSSAETQSGAGETRIHSSSGHTDRTSGETHSAGEVGNRFSSSGTGGQTYTSSSETRTSSSSSGVDNRFSSGGGEAYGTRTSQQSSSGSGASGGGAYATRTSQSSSSSSSSSSGGGAAGSWQHQTDDVKQHTGHTEQVDESSYSRSRPGQQVSQQHFNWELTGQAHGGGDQNTHRETTLDERKWSQLGHGEEDHRHAAGGASGRDHEQSYHQNRHEEDRSSFHHQQQGGGSSGNSGVNVHDRNSYFDNYGTQYSEEEYYGSEENNYDESQHNTNNNNNQQQQHSGSARNQSTYGQYDNRNYQENYAQHGLGAAALGHGFTAATLDLGVMGGSGASASGSSASGHSASGATHHAQGGSGQHHQQSGGSQWESHSESHFSSSGTGDYPGMYVGRDNVATDRPRNHRYHGRRRRQIDDNQQLDDIAQCKSTKCLVFKCSVGPLSKDQEAYVALRSRINVRTLRNITTSHPITFSSMMIARINKLPYIGKPLDRQIHTHEIFTSVVPPEPDTKPDVVPLWVVILSAVAGTIVLLLLVYLLYKVGFFKRNRPSDAPERQPLNRNGYYQNADAAL